MPRVCAPTHTRAATGTGIEAEVGAGAGVGGQLGLSLALVSLTLSGIQLCELSPDWIIVPACQAGGQWNKSCLIDWLISQDFAVASSQARVSPELSTALALPCPSPSPSPLLLFFLSLLPCVTWFVWIKYAQIDWLLKWCIVIKWFFSRLAIAAPVSRLSLSLSPSLFLTQLTFN